jgi:hypothetical protein
MIQNLISKKMDAENFAVAYSVLILGFTLGLSVVTVISNHSFEKAKSKLFEKDLQIDKLTRELNQVRYQYQELFELKEYMASILDRTNHLPPPPNTPLQRSRCCSEGNNVDVIMSDSETDSTD